MTRSLIDLAQTIFQSLDEFLEYHSIVILSDGFVDVHPICLYEIYCEQSENLLDYGTFCATLTDNANVTCRIRMSCANPIYFRERNVAYVYSQKKEKRFKKIPSFRS